MPTYRYEAIRTGGPKAEGIIEAADHARAVAQIRQSYDVVLRLEEISAPRRDRWNGSRNRTSKHWRCCAGSFPFCSKLAFRCRRQWILSQPSWRTSSSGRSFPR